MKLSSLSDTHFHIVACIPAHIKNTHIGIYVCTYTYTHMYVYSYAWCIHIHTHSKIKMNKKEKNKPIAIQG